MTLRENNPREAHRWVPRNIFPYHNKIILFLGRKVKCKTKMRRMVGNPKERGNIMSAESTASADVSMPFDDTPAPEGYKYIFVKYITRGGRRIDANEYGKQAFRIKVKLA